MLLSSPGISSLTTTKVFLKATEAQSILGIGGRSFILTYFVTNIKEDFRKYEMIEFKRVIYKKKLKQKIYQKIILIIYY